MRRDGRPALPSMRSGRALLERQTTELGMSEMFLGRAAVPVMDRDLPLVWQRHCPICGRQLEKAAPLALFVCRCGWRG